jgi:hypothetical protein
MGQRFGGIFHLHLQGKKSEEAVRWDRFFGTHEEDSCRKRTVHKAEDASRVGAWTQMKKI